MKKLLSLILALFLVFSVTSCTLFEENDFSPCISYDNIKYGVNYFQTMNPDNSLMDFLYYNGYIYGKFTNGFGRYDVVNETYTRFSELLSKTSGSITDFVVDGEWIYCLCSKYHNSIRFYKVSLNGNKITEMWVKESEINGYDFYLKPKKLLSYGDFLYMLVDVSDYTESETDPEIGYIDEPKKFNALLKVSKETGKSEVILKNIEENFYFFREGVIHYTIKKDSAGISFLYDLSTKETKLLSDSGYGNATFGIYENKKEGVFVKFDRYIYVATSPFANGVKLDLPRDIFYQIVDIDDRYIYYYFENSSWEIDGIAVWDYIANVPVGKHTFPPTLRLSRRENILISEYGIMYLDNIGNDGFSYEIYKFKYELEAE